MRPITYQKHCEVVETDSTIPSVKPLVLHPYDIIYLHMFNNSHSGIHHIEDHLITLCLALTNTKLSI